MHFRQDITKLYPPTKIKEEAENQKEFLVRCFVCYKFDTNATLKLQSTLIRNTANKGKGTVSKKLLSKGQSPMSE